jgi:hypothetical protein
MQDAGLKGGYPYWQADVATARIITPARTCSLEVLLVMLLMPCHVYHTVVARRTQHLRGQQDRADTHGDRTRERSSREHSTMMLHSTAQHSTMLRSECRRDTPTGDTMGNDASQCTMRSPPPLTTTTTPH